MATPHQETFLPIPKGVRIDNLLPLKTQAQGQDSTPEPKFLRAAGPMDREPARVFLILSPHKLIPRMLACAVKQAKSRKSLHQMED
ncbi:hypothetical protein DSO57_1007270 [Entomophthora muscae]|uniref:Uncharacterized protein n=1 Tax=Entomophthora muscae TaxID=34485 RepID=A0ACC2UGI0_9FUNG|nr:hypothetical protein DSO57_1007270 [Entomophthora muscae]